MKKRLLAFIISCITAFSAFVMPVYSQEDKTLHNARFLQEMGIIEFDYKNLEENILFEDALKALVRFSGYSEDVSDGQKAKEILKEMSLYPNMNEISITEPAKTDCVLAVMLSVIGYGPVINIASPSDVFKKASSLRLMKNIGIKTGGKITKGDFINLLRNGLDAEILQYNGNEFYLEDGVTVLSDLHKVTMAKGIISANYETSLTKNEGTQNKQVMINKVLYDDPYSMCDMYLGYEVEFYSIKEKGSDNRKIVYAYPTGRNKVLVIEDKDISSFKNRNLKYMENKSIRTARIGIDTDILYNFRPYKDYTESDFLVKNGRITLIDNDGDSAYDVCSILNFETVVVEKVDVENKVIFNKYDYKNNINLDLFRDDNVSITNSLNEHLEVDDLTGWDVLSVAKDKSGKSIKIIASSFEIEGVIENIEKLEDYSSVVIDGKEYRIEEKWLTGKDALKTGELRMFYTDYRGCICAVRTEGNLGMKYAYVCAAGKKGTLSGTVAMRIYTQDGQMEEIDLAKSVTVDSGRYTKNDTQKENMAKSLIDSIILYRANKDGEINYMKTKDGELKKVYSYKYNEAGVLRPTVQSNQYSKNTGLFGDRVAIGGESVIFAIPEDGDETRFEVWNQENLKGGNFRIEAYRMGDTGIESDAVAVYKTGKEGDLVNSVMVTKIDYAINKHGETVPRMHGYYLDKEFKALAERSDLFDNAPTIKDSSAKMKIGVGDIVQLRYNNEGEIGSVLLIYSAKSNTLHFNTNPSTTDTGASQRFTLGQVYRTEGSLVQISTAPISGENMKDEDLCVQKVNGSGLYLCDLEREECRFATLGDIYDYMHAGNSASRIVVLTVGGATRAVFIYPQ